MANKPHLILSNPKGTSRIFGISRGYEPKDIAPKPSSAYTRQKAVLRSCYDTFLTQRRARIALRTIVVPAHIEYIQIEFLNIFNDETKNRFKRDFGLAPVSYDNFNQTVLLVIQDFNLFGKFIQLLKRFYESGIDVHPSGKDYNIITIIKDFKFLSSSLILQNNFGDNLVFKLVDSFEIGLSFSRIFNSFNQYLTILKERNLSIQFNLINEDLIELKNISLEEVKNIIDNFDIIQKVQSFRYPHIRPNPYNVPELSWNLNINVSDGLPIIGILDTGIKKIRPLENAIITQGLDISQPQNPDPFRVSVEHGTTVASLALLGVDFFKNENHLSANAKVMSIKLMDSEAGYFSLFDLEKAVIEAYSQGVRIFNLSVVGYSKSYNTNFSEYAYLLDKLSYENDLIFFIATGNLDRADIQEIKRISHENPNFLTYPYHFYNPNEESSVHFCECSNICVPSESLNNITVGALAENLNVETYSDLTLSKELPAFYTKKFHYDYSRKINDTHFLDSQKNNKLFKPDIVMPGGDVLDENSAMQVIGLGLSGNDFYMQSSGTSLATPLAANIAARIALTYPSLNMQSIKALIINSANKPTNASFLDNLIIKLKNEEAQVRHHKNFDELERNEKVKISELFNKDILHSYLVGHGIPIIERCLHSTNKRITTVIEDTIQLNSHKAININLPLYLNNWPNPSAIVIIRASLCYKFKPILNNHLAYNPLHISFNLSKSLVKDDCTSNAEILANKNHNYFEQFYEPSFSNEQKTEARKIALGIKSKLGSWSDDFYPVNSKPFSNTQQIKINIGAEELQKVDNQISLIVRCTGKNDLEPGLLNFLETTAHPFSIALSFEEKDNDFFEVEDFYAEMQAINNLENIVETIIDNNLELSNES